jgi:peptide/nickel transport system substrate-binding protein
LLALGGSTAAAAALLAACGEGNSGGSGDGTDKSSLITKPEDTTKQAKRGGILKDRMATDAATMDPHGPIAPLNTPARHVYSTLVRQKAGFLGPNTTELSPDLAESWEVSPDGLTITMKLRNAKWHNKAPVNGRAFDSSDVAFSWNRYVTTAPLRGLVANSANPTAPIVSITAVDPRTISIKLKEPLVYALSLLASYGSFTGNVVMVPKEAENNVFDIRRDMIGTGPFFLSEYQPSVGFTLKRHGDYWDQNANLLDQINYPIVSDNSQVEAQLRAGNIHHFAVRAENLFTVKRDEPRLNIYAVDMAVAVTVMTFGQLPDGKSPLQDERVRQAFSMSIDRDTWIDAFYSVSNFRRDGLDVQTRWNSALPCDFTDMWLDGLIQRARTSAPTPSTTSTTSKRRRS